MSYIKDGKIEIMRNKGSTAKLLLLCVVFFLLCLYGGLFMDFDRLNGLAGRVLSTKVGGFTARAIMLVAAAAFVKAFMLLLQQSRNGKPLFTADENGVTDNSSAASAGVTVHWDNIKRIYIGVYKSQKFIELELNDTENFLRVLPESKRRNAAAYMNLGHQPVCITFVGTNVKPEDVLPDLVRLWEKYNGINLLSE